MKELRTARVAKARADRRLLKLGTVLGRGAAAAALLIPAAAFANLPARPPSSGTSSSTGQATTPLVALLQPAAAFQVDRADLLKQIQQATSSESLGSFAAGPMSQAQAISPPQDLTRRPLQRLTSTFGGGSATYSYGDITTTTDNTPGVITHYSGNTTITAGNITTSGDFSDGVSANGPYVSGQTGQISIKVGNVSTSGINSNGIYAANASGGIAITAGSISTTGAGASGIYTRSVGDTVIKAGDINASGVGVQAVGAGQMSITVGNVASGLTGISALAGGDVNITATSVTSATGSGIIAASGQFGTYYQAPTGGNVTISTGHVSGGGGGIYARTYGAGAINITAGSVSAIGPGIYARSGSSGGLYFQNGPGSNAIYRGLTVGGSVAVTAVSVSTVADKSVGIFAVGGSAEVTVSQAVTTDGNQSSGIVAISYDGDAIVHSNGSVQTRGAQSAGIYAYAGIPISEWGQPIRGNVTIDGGGDVTTEGPFSSGIVAKAWTSGGSVSITAGTVQTNGQYSAGISVLTSDFAFDKQVSNVTVDVQSVTTSGNKAPGIQLIDGAPVVFGWSVADGGQVDLNVHDSVSTRGYGSPAIAVVGYNNDVNISVANNLTTRDNASDGVTAMGNNVTLGVGGTISTQGDQASGVLIYGGGAVQITTATVQTTGDGANGIVAITPSASSVLCEHYIGCTTGGAVTISAGSITTAGTKSFGIYAAGYSGVTANVGSIATQGDGSSGLIAKAYSGPIAITETGGITTQGKQALGVIATDQNGPIDLTLTGAIATKGDFAAGAVAAAYNGAVNVQAGSITTTGASANALAAYSFAGSTTVNLGTASTAGLKAAAVFVEGQTGVTLTANQISTSGDDANALVIRSGGYGVIGNATVNVGAITTTGQHSAGIDAFTVGRSQTDPRQTSTLSINVGSITTSGIDSPGISALNPDGAINITASNISTLGYESRGVLTYGGGAIDLQVGSISTAAADAIYANGAGGGTITIGVSGKLAASGANGVVAVNAGGATNITIASTGSVAGAADAIQVQTGGGPVTVSNAGTITGGSGFAVDVTGLSQAAAASTQINNSGTLVGAVNLAAGGNNVLTNAGTFVASKDSFFGGGASQFVNTGVLKIAPATAGTVNFLGLATFQNAGGLIDLRTAPVGTVFSLSGDYAASGDARLGLGVNGNTADKLVIQGTATGATSILLSANPAAATLLAKPVTLVQAGAGSTGTFTLANPNAGLIHYGLQAASGAAQGPISHGPAGAAGAPVSYTLTASAGAPVYGMLKLEESAQTVWRQSADAWSEHLAAMRGDAWAGGQGSGSGQGANSGYGLGSGRYWVQAYGSTGDRSATVGTGYGGVSVDYNQTDAGVQVGADLIRTATRLGAVGWGVTAGYTSSQIDALGDTLKSDVDTFNLGGYAVLNHGPYFANGLVKLDHHQISTTDSVAGYQANLNGNSYGAQFEVGRHFGSDRFAFEPTVSLAWVRTSFDNASIDSQTLAFDDEDGVSGKIGGRFYANRTIHGTSFVFYAGAAAVDDFTGSQKATFYSGGTSQNVSADGEGAYAQAVAGVSARTMRDITLYLEGDANFGGDHSGAGVRLGARF